MIDANLIDELMTAVRVKSSIAEAEVMDLASACIADMRLSGVYVRSPYDALAKQAIKLYCKANYGYDGNTERFKQAYESLRDSMALSGDYEWGDSDVR